MTLSKGDVEVCHQGMNVIIATCCHLEWDLQPKQNEPLQPSLAIFVIHKLNRYTCDALNKPVWRELICVART